jgi:hypothetical protein
MKSPDAIRGNILGSILLCALLPLLAAGCGGRSGQKAGGHTYTVRARVQQLPSQDRNLYVVHEPIHNFVGRSGKIEGMDTMEMPFPVAQDVSLEGIAPDDVVEFQLHVDWDADNPVEITAIRELPANTELHFGEAKPQP